MKTKILIIATLLTNFLLAQPDSDMGLNEATSMKKKGKMDAQMRREIAETYFYNGEYQNALEHYKQIIEEDPDVLPIDFYRYGQCLKVKGQYQEGEEYLEKYARLVSKEFTPYSTEDYLYDITDQSGRYALKNEVCNTAGSDWPVRANGSMFYYLSTQSGSQYDMKTDMNTYDLWEANVGSAGMRNEQKMKQINSSLNEGGYAISKSGKLGYFTKNDPKSLQLHIYRGVFEQGEWRMKEAAHFCSDTFSVAEPVFSPDGSQIYFVSNMPGGFGETDIYVVNVFKDGHLGIPQNLGPKINTIGRENFPHFSKDGMLYFSSTGHNTLGGFDVFACGYDSTKKVYLEVMNVGEPVNSPYDDFAYLTNLDNTGYFASNRPNGKGRDDIYSFLEHTPLRPKGASKIMQKGQNLASKLFPDGVYTGIIDILDKEKYSTSASLDPGMYFLVPSSIDYKIAEKAKPIGSFLKGDSTYLSQQNVSPGEYFTFQKPSRIVAKAQIQNEGLKIKNDGSYTADSKVESGSYYLIPKSNSTPGNLADNEIEILPNNMYKTNSPINISDFYLIPTNNDKGNLPFNPKDGSELSLQDDGTFQANYPIENGIYKLVPKNADLSEDPTLGAKVLNMRADGTYFSKDKIASGAYTLLPRKADLSNVQEIKNIYFDLNAHTIRQDADVELLKVLQLLQANPNLKVRLSAHTDQRGSEEYNIKLSERRAEATKNYLVKKGIDDDRIFWDAKGAAFPVNDCPNMDCDEETFAPNRRVEFVLFN